MRLLEDPRQLPEALGILDRRAIFVVGSGGKTTLLEALARAFSLRGEPVLLTTTTKVWLPEGARTAEDPRELALGSEPRLLWAGRGQAGGKLLGWALPEVDLLLDHYPGRILVEADGSAGRSLKGHAAHEPVVSARADAVIAVVGASCLGQALDAAHVHRPERLAECLDLPMGSRLGVPEVVAAMLHPEGWRKALPPGAHAVLLVSQGRAPGAARLAEALRRAFPHVVLAELVAPETGPYQAQLGAGSPERRSTS